MSDPKTTAWRPIDTAPVLEKMLVAARVTWGCGWDIFIGYIHAESGELEDVSGLPQNGCVEYWQPLPEPPHAE